MKRILLITLSLMAFFAAFAQADTLTLQDIEQILKADPAKAGGNHYCYPAGDYSPAPAPKGYEAVYVSHYGRHGSRHATSASKYDKMADLLIYGHDHSRLTPAGEDLYQRYMEIYPKLEGHSGDLTVKGQQEHRGIARRMAAAYPKAIGKKAVIDARATTSHRAIISMMSFCDELRRQRPGITINYGADNADRTYTALEDPIIKASGKDLWKSLQDVFKNPEFIKYYAEIFVHGNEVAEAFFSRYFTDLESVKTQGDPAELMSVIFEVVTIMQCMDFEANFDDVFTGEELELLWERANIWAVLMFIGTPYTDQYIPTHAQVLLRQIMDTVDKDLAEGKTTARLRFSHDTIVGPLMALMGISGWNEPKTDVRTWKYYFQSWNLPMGSNIQFIIYRNKKDRNDLLVRVMYNEKDQILPLEDQSRAPYYKWSDFKAHYTAVCDDALERLAATVGTPVVKVEGGKVAGMPLKGGQIVYKGVPFAAPPVGELRDKPLQPVGGWEGVKMCNRFPAAASQSPVSPDDPLYYREFYTEGDPVYSDDCMYLNIWTPVPGTVEKAPVAVWIHGGAFGHGYSFEKEMDGEAWARKGVILVTIPYRLGELGFGTEEQLGFKDQVFALKWVHDNIAAFGGDPDNVTVLGQSAGAISVKYLLSNPEAQPLFAKAIIQSGGGLNVMDVPPILPVGTRGEIFAEALEKGAFDAKPIMIGYTANDPGFLGKPTTLEFCEKVSARGNGQVYTYEFRRDPPGEAEGEINWGAFHTVELWYTFATLGRSWRPMTEADYELSERTVEAWTSFVRSSNPGWESFNTETKHVEVFDIK